MSSPSEGAQRIIYLLYRTIPYFQPRDDDFEAIRNLSMPMQCDNRNDALGHARRVREAGGVAMLIEGSDGTMLTRLAIERELRIRAEELRGVVRASIAVYERCRAPLPSYAAG